MESQSRLRSRSKLGRFIKVKVEAIEIEAKAATLVDRVLNLALSHGCLSMPLHLCKLCLRSTI